MKEKTVWLLMENIEDRSRSYCREVKEAGDQTKEYGGHKVYNLIGKTTDEMEAREFLFKKGRWAE